MSLFRSIATIGGLTAVSRVLGFVLAALLGAGPVADAFFVALRFPNLFRSLFAEGAFSAAFVPIFVGMLATGGRTKAIVFAEQTLAVLTTALLAFVLLTEAAMPLAIMLLAPGFIGGPSLVQAGEFFRMYIPKNQLKNHTKVEGGGV